MRKIALDTIDALFGKMAETRSVYMPLCKNGQVNFDRWEEGEAYCAEPLKTVKSAKDLFFPQSEDLAAFRREGKSISVEAGEIPSEKFVLFGVRACDAKSFSILDRVFLAEPADQFYKARRENGVVITTACGAPEETCFCNVFGIDAANPGGDVATWIADGQLYWEAVTEKGQALTKEVETLLEEAGTEAVEAQKKEIASIFGQLPLAKLRLDGWNGDATKEKFDDPRWAELSEACLGCGACTFVETMIQGTASGASGAGIPVCTTILL